MFNFGESLYRLTQRDEETLLIDPFFRVASGSVAAASLFSSVNIAVPIDRSLFIHTLQIALIASALSTWESASVSLIDSNGTALSAGLFAIGGAGSVILGDNQANSGAGLGARINRVLELALPPFISAVRLDVTRLVSTNAATFALGISGYTIPPGRIGRA